MEYLVSEEELKGFVNTIIANDNPVIKALFNGKAKLFLKFKQPVKFLDRQEVEKIFNECWAGYLSGGLVFSEMTIEPVITAICNLALKEVSK